MILLKGFVTIGQYVNNTPGQISPLGELSTWSMTYSKEKGEYQKPEIPGYKLITFRSIDTVTGILRTVEPTQVSQIIELVRDCVSYATSHIRPYDPIDFKNTILAAFHSRISDLNFGHFVDNGSIALPEWISWNSLESDNPYVKIWLSDQAFADQYDDYSITVIPPVDTLDHFFNSFTVASNEILSRSMSVLGDKIQQAKDDHPESFIRIMTFDFINRLNPAQKTPTNWAVLIYGKTGDNIDAIKDAIVEYVLANSTHSRSEWEVILPDLFKRTEFIIMPRWDKMSIPNLTELAGLYSSMLDPIECVNFAKAFIDFYPAAWIDDNSLLFPYDYKAISLIAVNGTTNIPGKERLTTLYPDYIPVPSTSTDFARMQVNTREWVLLLERLLIVAETADEFTSVPNTLRRVKRNNKLFISAIFDNVNYLVATKSNAIYND